ncbi:hypothetical protein ACKS0A_04305 [Histoplasma ohiense]
MRPSSRAMDSKESNADVLYMIGILRPMSAAVRIARATCGTTCSGVTKLILWTCPTFCNFNIHSANSSGVRLNPLRWCEMSCGMCIVSQCSTCPASGIKPPERNIQRTWF